jgi:hypothetical protein
MPDLLTWCVTAVLHTRPLGTETQAATVILTKPLLSMPLNCPWIFSYSVSVAPPSLRITRCYTWRLDKKSCVGGRSHEHRRALSATVSLQAEYNWNLAGIHASGLMKPEPLFWLTLISLVWGWRNAFATPLENYVTALTASKPWYPIYTQSFLNNTLCFSYNGWHFS